MQVKGNVLRAFSEIQLIAEPLEDTSINKVPLEVNYACCRSPFCLSFVRHSTPIPLFSLFVNIKLCPHLFVQEYLLSRACGYDSIVSTSAAEVVPEYEQETL